MIRAATVTIAVIALLAAPVLARAPTVSPIPQNRPAGDSDTTVIRAVTLQAPQTGSSKALEPPLIEAAVLIAAPALLPEIRPRSRPEVRDGEVTEDTLAPAGPPPRPEDLNAEILVAASAPAAAPAVSSMVIRRSAVPRKRPETARLRHLQRVAAAVRARPDPGAVAGRESAALCGVTGIEGRTIPAVTSNVQACGIAEPVRVTAVNGVTFNRAAVMHCDTARALHSWVSEALRPALESAARAPAQLRVAAHYVCRTRNHKPGAPVSEHGKGRAIDISAIRLTSGEVISILEGWHDSHQGPILRAAHRAACGTFTTTLGPGSDGYHEDHFHYDTAQRRNAYCR